MLLLAEKRIFIVEDNAQNRVIYQIMLTRHGARVEFDRWGRDTLMKMKALEQFDLIILDLMLPNGDSGYDIFKSIRAISEFDNIPIVAVSAAEPSIAMAKTQALGFSGFIAKPINDDLFPRQLRKLIDGEKVWYSGENYVGG